LGNVIVAFHVVTGGQLQRILPRREARLIPTP
jgi:hypothetical protein